MANAYGLVARQNATASSTDTVHVLYIRFLGECAVEYCSFRGYKQMDFLTTTDVLNNEKQKYSTPNSQNGCSDHNPYFTSCLGTQNW